MSGKITGKVHSIQSLGTVDGPGVRFVVFMQGCNLRCKCCHNPDTWDFSLGDEVEPEELVKKALRYKEYFGRQGGVTLSGGEPLMQPEFAFEFFSLCRKEGLNTCLDTSGSIFNERVKELLSVTDRVLLDIKYTDGLLYRHNVGCEYSKVLCFLDYLNQKEIPTVLRQVIIPTVNDNKENIQALKKLADSHSCVEKIELLPFRKICQTKYDSMGIEFPFGNLREPSEEKMEELKNLI